MIGWIKFYIGCKMLQWGMIGNREQLLVSIERKQKEIAKHSFVMREYLKRKQNE
jgi:hypothetical protein